MTDIPSHPGLSGRHSYFNAFFRDLLYLVSVHFCRDENGKLLLAGRKSSRSRRAVTWRKIHLS